MPDSPPVTKRSYAPEEALDAVEPDSAGAAVSVPPQAASVSSMRTASSNAISFFMNIPPVCAQGAQLSFSGIYYTGWNCILQELKK